MIEKKFQQFKNSVSEDQFNDLIFLEAKAAELKKTDEALSNRILVRVANLKKQKKSQLNSTPVSERSISHQAEAASQSKAMQNASIQVVVNQPIVSAILGYCSKHLFITFIIIPTLLFAFYQCVLATNRFESQAQVIVQQPDSMATMDASMALLSGLGVDSGTVTDPELVKSYIYSYDMLQYLDSQLDLRSHYSASNIDLFSRLRKDASREDFMDFYLDHIDVYIDSASNVINISSQGFSPEFAQKLTQAIVKRAEWYINSIGHQLAEAQLKFIQGEHKNVENQLADAKSKFLAFQQQHGLLDPTAEGMAKQQLTSTLEGQISVKEAELKGLAEIMSSSAPQVMSAKNELAALNHQLVIERNKMTNETGPEKSTSQILASYANYKIKMELALQAYTSSQISLEKSRVEAYRQLKYLITVESATLPEDNKYPDAFYNVSLFILLASMLFAVIRIVFSTIRELK